MSELFLERHEESSKRIGEAVDAYHEVDIAAKGRCLCFAVRLNELAKRPDDADECMDSAMAILEPLGRSAEFAFAISQRAWLSLMRGDWVHAAENADRAIALAKDVDDQGTLINALNTRGLVAYLQGDRITGIAALEEAWKKSKERRNVGEEIRALHNLCSAALSMGDLQFARSVSARTNEAAERYKLPHLARTAQGDYATVLFHEGRWAEAEDLATETLSSIPETASFIARELHLLVGRIQSRKGQPEGQVNLERSWSVMGHSREPLHMAADGAALVEHMWLTGDFNAERVEACASLIERFASSDGQFAMREAAELAFWMWKIGRLTDVPVAIAEPYRLLMEGDPCAAAAIWADQGFPYERAIALGHGDVNAQLEAVEILVRLGARAVAAKLHRALREKGVRVPALTLSTGRVGTLTPRQTEVLSLLAEQMSNADIADRLFLSPRTVENHVAAVMAKLDAPTRQEAVAVAVERGLIAADHNQDHGS